MTFDYGTDLVANDFELSYSYAADQYLVWQTSIAQQFDNQPLAETGGNRVRNPYYA
jgi:hypothetical protein